MADIRLNQIESDPTQARKHFAGIENLAESLKESGQAVPVLVRKHHDGYMLIHGERRYQAATLLGWETIRAEIMDVKPEEARWLSLSENVQRQDLTPIEEAEAFQSLIHDGVKQKEIAQRIGKDRSYIAQKLRLLTLPPPLKCFLAWGALTEGHMRQLMRLKKMYPEDITFEFPQLDSRDDTKGGGWESEEEMAKEYLLQLRPLDNPWFWLGFCEDRPLGNIEVSAVIGFLSWTVAEDYVVPRWIVTAFWWACAAVYVPLNVTHLSKFIDKWFDQFRAAIFALSTGKQPSESEDLNNHKVQKWHAYNRDLCCAGAEAISKKEDRISDNVWFHQIKAIQWGCKSDRILLPSAMQPSGNLADVGNKIMMETLEAEENRREYGE